MFDPTLTAQGRGPSGYFYDKINNSWGSDSDASLISSEGYAPSDASEAAFAQNIYEGVHLFTASLQGASFPAGSRRGRLDVIRPTGTGFWTRSIVASGSSGAWLSYDMSGEAEKNIFAYSFEIIAELSGTGAQSPLTGQDYKVSELLYLNPTSYEGACSDVSLILSVTGETCSYSPRFLEEIAKTKFICVPNSLQTDAQISGFIESGLAAVASSLSGAGNKAKQPNSSAIVSNSESFSYSLYEGLLAFNSPYSGDSISFYPYAYDYTGLYQQEFGIDPPFPAHTTTFVYPNDYSDVDGLVSAINTHLSGSGQFLWDKDALSSLPCSSNQMTGGLFESGNLLKATKSGNSHILIQSTRAGDIGRYQISFLEAPRPSGASKSNKKKLMLPNSVYLEGSVDNLSWSEMGRLNPNWSQARSMFVDLTDYTLNVITGSREVLRVNPPDPSGAQNSGLSPKLPIYSGTVESPTKCNEILSRDVEFYRVERPFLCSPPEEEESSNSADQGYFIVSGLGGSGITTATPANALVYKTGAKYSTTGNYNYYRIRFDNLVANQQGELSDVSDIMYVSRVSFFGVRSGAHELTGSTCILGADYSGQVMGYTTGIITGSITGEANLSGQLNLDRYVVTGTPSGTVTFQYSQGVPVGTFTGLVSAAKAGTGFYSDEVQGYYYNSGNDSVYFQAPVSGVISGSGNMTGGAYLVINDSFIESATPNYQEISGTLSGSFTGVIPDFSYSSSDIPSFITYEGFVTGVVGSGDLGYFDASVNISIIPTGTVYSISLSGTREASASILFGVPASGDTVFVNEIPFTFSSELGDSYFDSKSSLAAKVSSNESTDSTGIESGSYVFLRSTRLGSLGNSIPLSYSGGGGMTGPSYFTGGEDVRYPLSASQPFTGRLDSGIYAVEYITTGGSGFLTGEIKQLDFVRHFSGVWDIISGATSFRDSAKYSFGRYINSGFETLSFYSGRPDHIPLTITYSNSPYVPTIDLVKLTVTGYDSLTGLSVVISGKVL
jgi:hypothetical protein